jgi:hypothetical protein
MKTAPRALVWELVWKNRVVIPALALLLILGGALAFTVRQAPPDAGWGNDLRSIGVVAFLTSLLLTFGSFTLMESHSSWRMNSMATRWFILPVRTAVLVWLPLVLGWLTTVVLVLFWTPILRLLAGRADLPLLLALPVFLMAVTQTVAWATPRKPGQYWSIMALLSVIIVVLPFFSALLPRWQNWRAASLGVLLGGTLVLGVVSSALARLNRCGDWPGGLPFEGLMARLRRPGRRTRPFGSAARALIWSDAMPVLRVFTLSWLLLAGLLVGGIWLLVVRRRPELAWAFQLRQVATLALDVLPRFAACWLVVWGMAAGCEPFAGFCTRFSSFRATLPVTAGALAGTRLQQLAAAWGLVWLPLVVLAQGYDFGTDLAGPGAHRLALLSSLGWRMTVSAHAMVGALPLLLWGRLEGFPTLLLTYIVAWAGTWGLVEALDVEGDPGWHWWVMASLLAAKVGVAAWLLIRSYRNGHASARFVVSLAGGWVCVAACLIWVLPTLQTGGAWRAVMIVLLLPLARLAACPLAVAANRHR